MMSQRSIKPVLEEVQDQLKVHVYDQREAMGKAAAADIRAAMQRLLAEKSTFASSLRLPHPRMNALRRWFNRKDWTGVGSRLFIWMNTSAFLRRHRSGSGTFCLGSCLIWYPQERCI